MSQVQENEATYAEVSSPPTAKERFDMDENQCYSGLKVIRQKNAAVSNGNKNVVIALVVTIVLVVMLILAVAACCTVFALRIFNMKSETVSAEQEQSFGTIADRLDSLNSSLFQQLLQMAETVSAEQEQNINNIASRLENYINSSVDILFQQQCQDYSAINTRIQQLNTSLHQQVNDLQTQTQQIIDGLGRPGQHSTFPATSCATLPPFSPSGHYWVRASNGFAVRVYCDMTRLCGGVTGGWMRVAELDMTNSSHQCPSGLVQRNHSNIRTCVNPSSSPSCSSDIVNTVNIVYTRVCGRIIGYQIGHTNAFASPHNIISSEYVDGVSLTHGTPRQHIWTFAAARDENDTSPTNNCPCTMNISEAALTYSPPAFVGSDYFCDTGSNSGEIMSGVFYGTDPLWDGAGCGPMSTCCSFNTPPWFYKQLPQPTTDNIEIRVCRDEHTGEGIAIEMVEMYVQ